MFPVRHILLFAVFITVAIPSQAADITQKYKYQVLVEEKVNGIDYRDAIYYDQASWDTLTQAKVNTEITKRTDNFKYVLEHPAIQVPPTKAELQAQKAELTSQIAYLDGEIAKK